jgi:hypothetical protein
MTGTNVGAMIRRGGSALVLLVAALVLIGCGSATPAAAPDPVATAVPAASENPYGILDIDPPGPDEAILTVAGPAGTLQLTSEALLALGSTEITIFEPFVRKDQTFVGVPLATLVREAQIDGSAQLLTIALNDYRYSASVADLLASDALIAYKVDGRLIGYDEGGPVRLVFPTGTALFTVLDAWNWSLKELRQT